MINVIAATAIALIFIVLAIIVNSLFLSEIFDSVTEFRRQKNVWAVGRYRKRAQAGILGRIFTMLLALVAVDMLLYVFFYVLLFGWRYVY